MTSTSRSEIALWVSRKAPSLAGVGVRLWATGYRRGSGHWLFRKLKSELGLRIVRRARLCTGQVLAVDPFDSVGRDIVRAGCYEPETVALFRQLLVPGMVVVDAGAHVGQYTVISSALVGDSGQVHSFEPDPVTFRQLRGNVARNDCHNVRCTELALGRVADTAMLALADVSNIGGNSLRAVPGRHRRGVAVRVATLDDYARRERLARLDVLKADVEGAELDLLRGGEDFIRRFKPTMILELSGNSVPFGYTSEHLCSWLEERGYTVFRVAATWPLQPYVSRPDDLPHFNVLALHADRASEPGVDRIVGSAAIERTR